MKEAITESTGNVFVDLGFEPGEAAILQMRATLMHDLQEFIVTNGLTPVDAATRLGIAHARVSDLMQGKWEKFSLETLITLATKAGRQVTVELAA
jgi:predicted XRE-type DNA-binding protein